MTINLAFIFTDMLIDLDTLAVPCDGKVECQGAADESWLCTDQYIIIYVVLGNKHNDIFQNLMLFYCSFLVDYFDFCNSSETVESKDNGKRRSG